MNINHGLNCSRMAIFRKMCSRNIANKPTTGIVMLNMGGPQTLDQVNSFLQNIITDRDMIKFPMQDILGFFIAKVRSPNIQRKYKEIGGGSPIYKWTKRQGELMCEQLDKVSPATSPHKYYVGLRYSKPFTEDALIELEQDGVKRAIFFSQYPHYSCATAGSSYNMIYEFYKDREYPKDLKCSVIDRWGTNHLLVRTFSNLIQNELNDLPEEIRKKTIILFSAHSLPLRVVNRGDSYPYEVGATVELVMKELNYCNSYQLVWQSRVGPLPWLGPSTKNTLKAYTKKGLKNFILVPIAFVNEHIETLHELDIEYCRYLAKELKIYIRRVPAPNDHPIFIDALTNLIKNHLENEPMIGTKFLSQCPNCSNKNCELTKKWFSKMY